MNTVLRFAILAVCLVLSPLAEAQGWREITDDLLSFSFKAPSTSQVQRLDEEGKRSYYSSGDARPVVTLDVDYLRTGQSWASSPKEMYKQIIDEERENSIVRIDDVMEFTFRGSAAIRYKKSIGGGSSHEYFMVRRGNQLFTMFTSDSGIADRFFDSLTFK